MIHIQTATTIARWYDEANGFEQKLPYRAICSITHLTDKIVYIHGMHGKITKADMLELFIELSLMGIEQVTAERKGEMVTRDVKFLIAKAIARNSKSELSQAFA
jgi:hypothetical protein